MKFLRNEHWIYQNKNIGIFYIQILKESMETNKRPFERLNNPFRPQIGIFPDRP
jgi:hypothetical protein